MIKKPSGKVQENQLGRATRPRSGYGSIRFSALSLKHVEPTTAQEQIPQRGRIEHHIISVESIRRVFIEMKKELSTEKARLDVIAAAMYLDQCN